MVYFDISGSYKIAGDFTDWEPSEIFSYNLTDGIYEFKFLLDNNWVCSPNYNKRINNDGYENNYIVINTSDADKLCKDGESLLNSDINKAIEFFKLAADNYSIKAMFYLTQIYKYVINDPQSYTKYFTVYCNNTGKEPPIERQIFLNNFIYNSGKLMKFKRYPAKNPYYYDNIITYIVGDFTNWLPVLFDYKTTKLFLPDGVHQFKFIIDGEWDCGDYFLTMNDGNGNINNYITIKNSKYDEKFYYIWDYFLNYDSDYYWRKIYKYDDDNSVSDNETDDCFVSDNDSVSGGKFESDNETNSNKEINEPINIKQPDFDPKYNYIDHGNGYVYKFID